MSIIYPYPAVVSCSPENTNQHSFASFSIHQDDDAESGPLSPTPRFKNGSKELKDAHNVAFAFGLGVEVCQRAASTHHLGLSVESSGPVPIPFDALPSPYDNYDP